MLRGGGVSDGYIEARPRGVSKGLFVNHAVATMKANNYEPDFILAIGDQMPSVCRLTLVYDGKVSISFSVSLSLSSYFSALSSLSLEIFLLSSTI